MEWISVEDKLPEIDEHVLISNGNYVNFGWIDSNYYNYETDELQECWVGANLGWDGDSDKVEVTHWMPIPKPPKILNQNK